MPILTALFSLVSRQLSSLLRAILGWSVSALFGRLSDTRATILSGVLIVSLAWPILVLGVFFPSVSAWVFAMVPLQKWVGATVVRVGSIVLAAIVPAVIGLTVRAIAPAEETKGGTLRTMLGGYPLTLGFALACLITAVVVPITKLRAMSHGWSDAHVYVQTKKGRYDAALAELVKACAAAGITAVVEPVPASMDLAGKVLKLFARGTITPLVPSDTKRLRSPVLEVYLYPADLLLRGKTDTLARVRARLVDTHLEREAFLVAEHDAQVIQSEIVRLAEARDSGVSVSAAGEQDRVRRVRALLDERPLPFEEWVLLDRSLRRLEERTGVGSADRRPDGEGARASLSRWQSGITRAPQQPSH